MLKYLIGAAALVAAGSANAVVTISSQPLDVDPPAGSTVVLDFEAGANLPAGYSITGSGFGFYTGTTDGVAAAPAGDDTQYLAVLGGGSATINFPSRIDAFSVYIGSVDSFNSITFNYVGGGSDTVTGDALVLDAEGNQFNADNNRRFFFTFAPGVTVDSVVLSSTNNSFELDNIATSVVPEPATWALMILGFGLVGFAARRRNALAA